jgi:ABC-type dipeptide/oligopeptide/nickel transport system permease subunit
MANSLARTKARSAPADRSALSVMRGDARAVIGVSLIVAMVLAAVIAPLLTSYDPTAINLAQQLMKPSGAHWLGTDIQGRDILARLLFGARISLSVGLGAQTIALVVGGTLGLVSGYYGRWVDEVVMRIADVTLAFPTLLLLIAMVAAFQPSLTVVTITIGIVGWAGVARLVRGQVLVVRGLEYVQAARALGGSDIRVLARHVLPAVTAPLVIVGTLGIAAAIMAESSLSFLGLGVQPPTPSWGGMIADARDLSQLRRAPWTSLAPGLTIGCAVLAFNLLGDALRDATDPKQLTRRLARDSKL